MHNLKLMEDSVELINLLNSTLDYVGGSIDVALPQIVIIGDKSCGKSSIIDSLIGLDILPKGPDINNRCPLIIDLVQNNDLQYARFSHKPHQMIFDVGQIKEEIIIRTRYLIEKGSNYSKKSINLAFYSPKVLTLKIIEIPGLIEVKNPINTTDPEIIEELIKEYVSADDIIIISIIEANKSLLENKSFKILKSMKKMQKTIGVISKLDLLESDNSLKSVLENRIIVPGGGWVLVKNRTTEELLSKKDLKDSLNDEVVFMNEKYSHISKTCGNTFLKNIIFDNIKNRIIGVIPETIRKLQAGLNKSQELVDNLKYYSDNIVKKDIILKICQNISEKVNSSIGLFQRMAELEKMTIGVIINNHMNDGFNQKMKEIREQKGMLRNMVITAVKNSIGITGFIEIPDKSITSIIRHSNQKFQEVTEEILSQLSDCVKNCIVDALEPIEHYAYMHSIFENILNEFVDQITYETKKKVEIFFEIDSSHTYFGDLSFMNRNWEYLTANTNIEVFHTIFKTEIDILNLLQKPEYSLDYILLVDDSCVSIFKKSNLQRKFCFQNKHLRVKFTNTSSKPRNIRISSKFDDKLTKKYDYLDIMVESETEYNSWKSIFISKGIFCDEIMMIYSNLNHSDVPQEDMVRYEKMCLILEKYLYVNRIKIQDIMIKILMKSLIYGFEDYCTYKLSSIILEHKIDDLFKVDEQNKRSMNTKIFFHSSLKKCYDRLFKYVEEHNIKLSDNQTDNSFISGTDSTDNYPSRLSDVEETEVFISKRPTTPFGECFGNIIGFFSNKAKNIDSHELMNL